MGKVTVRIGRLVGAASATVTLAGAGAGRGLARTRTPHVILAAAALAAGLTVTACSPAYAPGGQGGGGTSAAGQGASGGGAGGAAPAGQAGQDPGCQAIASQVSTISSQLSATSGNYSAQVPVLQAWYNDLQSAQQEAQDGVAAGALGDTASGVEDIIVDEQNLMDDPSIGFNQLDSDDSAYQSDVSNLETACGFSS
jgi:hypothetical protein